MTRYEYNEFRYVRKTMRQFTVSYGTICTIPTDAGAEYKHRLHDLYTSYGMHPASICTDSRLFDGRERIHYIFGLTYDLNGEQRPWTDLYTKEEKARFAAALD